MGAENREKMSKLENQKDELELKVNDLAGKLRQSESDKLQLQASYEEALQALADSEAKREIADKELRLAHDQITSMWKELASQRKKLDSSSANIPMAIAEDSPHLPPPPSIAGEKGGGAIELRCTLCKEKIKPASSMTSLPSSKESTPSPQPSPKQQRPRRGSWLFGRKQAKIQDSEAHSKVCSASSSVTPKQSPKSTLRKSVSTHNAAALATVASQESPRKQNNHSNSALSMADYLLVNVTRGSHAVTDLAPFKIVTKTNMSQFPHTTAEVFRSQGDFQWLYEALQEACPERIVPPLKPPISLDATMSEFQRFLTRLSSHKTLKKHHLFIVFLSGSAEELRSLRAKYRPRRGAENILYKPAVGRDTNSGPLVSTKEYLAQLEQNILGLISHLEQAARKRAGREVTGHWFRAISEAEPKDKDTYLKRAASDLSRTCEAIDSQHSDSDDTFFIQNLQSVADYIKTGQDLVTRVEEAVDKYLYWDEEVTIIEAVTSSPVSEQPNSAAVESGDEVFDDSGVSSITSSSNNSSEQALPPGGHVTSRDSLTSSMDSTISTSEKWAQASKFCADAKDYLEMMCRDLSDELAQFDLHKETELKQVLLDYAAAQLEKHEKFQGKWFAMKFLLDSPILPRNRAITFSNGGGPSSGPPPPHSSSSSSSSSEAVQGTAA